MGYSLLQVWICVSSLFMAFIYRLSLFIFYFPQYNLCETLDPRLWPHIPWKFYSLIYNLHIPTMLHNNIVAFLLLVLIKSPTNLSPTTINFIYIHLNLLFHWVNSRLVWLEKVNVRRRTTNNKLKNSLKIIIF